jgi:uncharacterized protein YndB with AHSA1/START domain
MPPTANYQSRVTINAPREAVFDALTSIEGLSGWWTPAGGSGIEGGELRFTFGDEHPLVIAVGVARRPAEVVWRVLEYATLPDWVGTSPRFEVRQIEDGVSEVAFEHVGLTPQLECYEMCRLGWDYYLPSLRDYVETGMGRPGPGAGSRRLAEVEGERDEAAE